MEIRRGNIWSNVDWVLIGVFITLSLLGWINIYAAGYKPEFANIFDSSQEYGKQFIWICTALGIGIVVFLADDGVFTKLGFLFYGIFMLLLVLVLFLGKDVNGARSWFGVGSFGIQPSEFAKVGTALALPAWMNYVGLEKKSLKNVLIALAIIGLPAALIMLQPDTGTALVFFGFVFVLYRFFWVGNIILAGILATMLAVLSLIMKATEIGIPFSSWAVSGQYFLIGFIWFVAILAVIILLRFVLKRFRKKYIIWVASAAIISTAFILTIDYAVENVLSPHQTKRVHILLGLEEDPQGAGYNVRQSKVSIGSGGFAGKGFLEGTLTKFKYVPMQSTDFIFCTIGEEWGFLGTSFVVGMFLVLIFRIMFIAERQRSVFTRVYAYAIASIFFVHLTINVGMAIGLAPVIGIPLPFFSYGGSSLWAFTILLAVLLKLDSKRLDVLR